MEQSTLSNSIFIVIIDMAVCFEAKITTSHEGGMWSYQSYDGELVVVKASS